MLDDGGPKKISDEEMVSLLKSTLENGFQLDKSDSFSSVLDKKRQLKHKKIPQYRRINTYFKSTKQYWKERNRRKQIMELAYVQFLNQKEIATKLGISVSTVKRDLRKVRRFIRGQTNRAIRIMREERHRAFEQAMEGLSLREQFDYLSMEMERYKKIWHNREYRRHYQIILIDMTQLDKYGIPKLTLIPGGNQTLAYPYKIRVQVKGSFEGREFTADIGGFNITQRTGW